LDRGTVRHDGLRGYLHGLRISELVALKWNDIHGGAISISLTAERQQEIEDLHGCSITIDETFCRGDWNEPKSASSNATIAINPCVIARIKKLKTMTVEVRAGNSVRKIKIVRKDGPDDLVFQGLYKGKPINDNNVQRLHIKPAAEKLGWDFVNWRCLRTSHATWLKLSGADPKDAQGQLRHSRVGTTLDIYQQFVSEQQHRVVAKLSSLSKRPQ
jgi:integrase